jgi:hypothetical protein
MQKGWLSVLVATWMIGCGGMPGDDKTVGSPSEPGTVTAPATPTATGGGSAATATAPAGAAATAAAAAASPVEQLAGKRLSDPSFSGMIDMGTHQGWTVYLEKSTNQAVATDGMSSVTFDPNGLDPATVNSLLQMGIPEELLWSWKGVICRAACWAAAGAGCAAVAGACTWGTVVTFGGFGLPCSYATVAACGASAGGASVCSDWCSRKFG